MSYQAFLILTLVCCTVVVVAFALLALSARHFPRWLLIAGAVIGLLAQGLKVYTLDLWDEDGTYTDEPSKHTKVLMEGLGFRLDALSVIAGMSGALLFAATDLRQARHRRERALSEPEEIS